MHEKFPWDPGPHDPRLVPNAAWTLSPLCQTSSKPPAPCAVIQTPQATTPSRCRPPRCTTPPARSSPSIRRRLCRRWVGWVDLVARLVGLVGRFGWVRCLVSKHAPSASRYCLTAAATASPASNPAEVLDHQRVGPRPVGCGLCAADGRVGQPGHPRVPRAVSRFAAAVGWRRSVDWLQSFGSVAVDPAFSPPCPNSPSPPKPPTTNLAPQHPPARHDPHPRGHH
jgi:hypothetical protein